MEILVTLAIFSTAIVIIANIFVLSSRAQQKTSVIENVQSDARFSMESMVREVRAGRIDYNYENYNNNLDEPEEELALRDINNQLIVFFKDVCEEDEARQCLKVNMSGSVADLTGSEAEVEDLKFYISPLSNPFMPLPEEEGDCWFPENYDSANRACLCEEDSECFPDQSCIDTGEEGESGNIMVCKNADIQPRVTIILRTRSSGGGDSSVNLQTTVSTKNYER